MMVSEIDRLFSASETMRSKLVDAAARCDDFNHAQLMLDASELLAAIADRMLVLEDDVDNANVLVQRLLASP